MRHNCFKILVFMAIASPALATARPIQTEFIPVTYTCERGVELPVIYVNDTQGRSNAIATIDGKLLKLSQVVSASGARYRDKDETAISYEIWNKGDKAIVTYGTVEESKVLFEECKEPLEADEPEQGQSTSP